MTINNKTTFKELKKLVGSTKELAKLPTAKELRNSNEEIVFDGDVAGAHFIIYKSGLFIYSRSGHATVMQWIAARRSNTRVCMQMRAA